ncbi:hypothetical protein BKA70DRAFT_1137610 [Coprinopsis sp. MPI-PUGE-AT-0042]|nr:hypothetical protein BKA70DRAFT_1137610 [Coprinopsis sp. MPI-PUGE-AT-0042]
MPSIPPASHEASSSHPVSERRSVPKLDGSAPAFIALVVVLVVVTIVSTAGILYMLWDNRQKNDKSARLHRYQSKGAEDGGWVARLGRIFGSRKPEPLHRRETSDKEMMQDWAQSAHNIPSTRDILATIREEQSEHQAEDAYTTTDYTPVVTPSTRSPAVSILDANHRLHRAVPSRSRTYASSHLSTSEGSIRSMSVASYRSRHDSSGPHIQPSIPSIAEHLASPSLHSSSLHSSSPSMSPSPLIKRLGSPDSFDHIYPNGRGRPFATQSGTSITLEGGTKFHEEL